MKLLHLFHWMLTDITKVVEEVKEQGFDAIQISPIQGTKDNGNEWWKLYQPTNLKIGNSQIGSRQDLIELCKKCKEHGIKVIADIVLRHCAGANDGTLRPHPAVDPELLPFIANDQINCDDYNDRWKSIHRCTGMPIYNYNSRHFHWKIVCFMNELIECGVYGFRLDQLKHFPLPSEGCDILCILSNYHIYGEAIYCSKDILDKYTEYMPVITEGRPTDTSRLVAKFETHDDYLEFKTTCKMTDNMRLSEWDTLVNKCGYTSIFYARPYDDLWKSDEMRLINRRNEVCLR